MSAPTTMPDVAIAREMLIRCRDQFQFYGDQHAAKYPPQHAKAAVNYKFVAEINATLLSILPGVEEAIRSPEVIPAVPQAG